MKILVACEESQAVTKEFRELGHEAYSCDIIECSGGKPEWHIMQDVIPLLNGNCEFITCDNTNHLISGKWDMIIAFPPCTRLCSTAQRWYFHGTQEYRTKKLKEKKFAINFFMQFVNADCDKIAIENPRGIMSTIYKKPTQIIEPFMFGDPHKKVTCLWLKGLQKLQPTNIVEVIDYKQYELKNGGVATFSDWYNAKNEKGQYLSWNSEEIKKARSKTFPGIAKAMANTWGK